MELVILGSGGYQPDIKRNAPGYLVKIGNENLVLDFGSGTLKSLLKTGLTYKDIDAIFITHLHSDHVSELIPFIHIAFCTPLKNGKREKDLSIYGPSGLGNFIKGVYKIFPSIKRCAINLDFKLSIKELKNFQIRTKNWQVRSILVEHGNEPALAYRIEENNKSLIYSGDTSFNNNILKISKNADVCILEATWPEELDPKTHLTAQRAGEIASKSNVKKLILTHFSPYYANNFDIQKEAAENFKGPIILAEDLMKIKI